MIPLIILLNICVILCISLIILVSIDEAENLKRQIKIQEKENRRKKMLNEKEILNILVNDENWRVRIAARKKLEELGKRK
jgi:hypothetical protein